MHKFVSIFLVFAVFFVSYALVTSQAHALIYIGAGGGAAGGGLGAFLKPCFELTSCGISIAISVFLQLFGSKIACLAGAQTGFGEIITKGLKGVPAGEVANAKAFVQRLNSKNSNFGGKILQEMECKCKGLSLSKDFLGKKKVYLVGDPMPAAIAPVIGSKIYDYGALKRGNFVLGKTTPVIACVNPVAYAIDQVGTSK